jgi:hypothetical protein
MIHDEADRPVKIIITMRDKDKSGKRTSLHFMNKGNTSPLPERNRQEEEPNAKSPDIKSG